MRKNSLKCHRTIGNCRQTKQMNLCRTIDIQPIKSLRGFENLGVSSGLLLHNASVYIVKQPVASYGPLEFIFLQVSVNHTISLTSTTIYIILRGGKKKKNIKNSQPHSRSPFFHSCSPTRVPQHFLRGTSLAVPHCQRLFLGNL